MESNEFKVLKKERTQLRRAFTVQGNTVEEALSSDVNQVHEEFAKLTDKAQRLFRIDDQVSSLLYSLDISDEELDEEFENTEAYRDRWTVLTAKINSLIKKEEEDKISVLSTSSNPIDPHNKISYVKYPKLKFKNFDGNIKNWVNFWSQFRKIHEDLNMDLDTKFQYLYHCTEERSQARELIDSFPPCAANYNKAIELMKERFGRDDLLIEMYVRELLSLVLENAGKKFTSLRSLYDRLETQLRALETLGVTTEKYACMLHPLVESSLPESVLREWERKRVRENWENPMDELLKFIRKEVESEERIALAQGGLSATETGCVKVSESKKSHDVSRTASKKKIATAADLVSLKGKPKKSCIFCEGRHANEDCHKAREFELGHIRQLLMNGHCCLICLKGGHIKKDCRTYLKCIICGKRHVPLVCPERKRNEIPPEPEQTKTVATLSNAYSNQVYLKTLKVMLQNKDKSYPCRLFIDDGAQRSYVSNRMISLLKYEPVGQEKIIHSLFGGKRTLPENHSAYTIQVASVVNNYVCKFKALNKETICDPLPIIHNSGDLANELKTNNIILSGEEWGPIDILVGADIAGRLFTGRKVNLINGLVALETSLGWTLMGEINEKGNKSMTNVCFSNVDGSPSDLWRLEVIGIEDRAQTETRNECQLLAKQHFEDTVKINGDGRYVVKLPWLDNHPPLPTNYEVALKRLDSVTRKMTPEVKSKYNEVFNEWLAESIIEKVPSEDINCVRSHYLPHRPIIKESGTTKIRPVFDASSRVKGAPSLNQCLHVGQNLIELIPSLLLRFRLEQYGVISDVKKAFLQIAVNEEDKNYLRFLWRDDHNNLVNFRHTRVVFGVNSSPFLLAAVFERLLDKFKDRDREENNTYVKTAIRLKKALYVDNCVTSVSSEEELHSFIKKATYIFSSAKFELRGWEYTDHDLPTSTSTPVLGIQWNRRSDVLTINVPNLEELEVREVTRRSLLSIVQKIFDPIGVTAPTTLIPKLLIQQTWIAGGGWDSEIDEELRGKFIRWVKEAPSLREIEFPRWIKGVPREQAEVSLHTFCDASQSAYAAVCFVRVASVEITDVYLVGAKSRVAPIKNCTIPRLELLAAVIGARLAHSIQEEFKDVKNYYWSDSSTALSWIKRDEPWGVFVFNRVVEIRNLTEIDSWRHIPGIKNPADLLSRGCSPKKLLFLKWWEGPEWLRKPEEEWPVPNICPNEEEISAERKKKVIVSANLQNNVSFTYYRYFSDYTRIVRELCWILRFINNTRKKIFERQNREIKIFNNIKLSAEEYKIAEIRLLKLVQAESFEGTEDKTIRKLKPQLDSDGLIRIRTKIWARKDSFDFRAPILLAPNHVITERLIFETHRRNLHVVGQMLLNILREKYWVIRGRQAVRRVVNSCRRCLRYASKKMECESPPLPEDRVRNSRIFEVVGVDLAGPLYLRDGQKVWIALFTCAIYRAVHLEVVLSLSAEDFLLALRRFIARRGRPVVIISDNGTNFKGSSRLISNVNWKKITSTCDSITPIEWRFNPPSAPWWGGFFERLIGVLKELLRKNLGRARLKHDELCTIICECEAIINARPITYVSDCGDDLVPITPQMFLGEVREAGVPDLEEVDNVILNRRLKYRFKLKEELRKRFRAEYLGQLTSFRSNFKNTRDPVVGEIVLIGSDNKKRLDWPLAVIEELVPGRDGKCRLVLLRTADGKVSRPIQRIYPLEVFSPPDGNSDRSGEVDEEDGPPNEEDGPPNEEEENQPQYCDAETRSGRKVRLPVRYR